MMTMAPVSPAHQGCI